MNSTSTKTKTNKLIKKQKMQQEVYKLQAAEKLISADEFTKKYGISRASFYNYMKEWGIDITSYNKQIKEEMVEEVKEEKPTTTAKFNFKINKAFVEGSKKSDFSISPREKLWDSKKNEIVVDIKEKEEKPTATAEVKEEIIEGEKVYDFNSANKPFIIAGLISERHETIDNGTKIFIFNGKVRSDLIHDYDWMYQQADTFIKQKVIGGGYQKLKLIVTGLTQAVTSTIKAAYDNGITLVLMHYDNSIAKYREQFICGDNTTDNQSLINLFASVKRNYNIKLVGHDLKHYQELDHMYIVKIENLSDKFDSPTVYVTDDMNVMFKIYSSQVQKLMTVKFISYRVSADDLTFGSTKQEFKFPNTFGTYYNMPRS